MIWDILRDGKRYAYVGTEDDAKRICAWLATKEPQHSWTYRPAPAPKHGVERKAAEAQEQ